MVDALCLALGWDKERSHVREDDIAQRPPLCLDSQ